MEEPHLEEQNNEQAIPQQIQEEVTEEQLLRNVGIDNQGTIALEGENVAARDIINNNYNDDNRKDLTGSHCPSCGEPANGFGRTECNNCQTVFYTRNPNVDISSFRTLSSGEQSEHFKKLLFGIKAALKEEKYGKAWAYCEEATSIELGIREPIGWTQKSLCLFFKMSNNQIIKTACQDIIKNIDIAKEAVEDLHPDKENDEYINGKANVNEMASFLSSQIFHIIRSRLRYAKKPQENEETGKLFWRTSQREMALYGIRAMEACYQLFPDKMYLEEIVNELSTPRKWILHQPDGELERVSFPKDCWPDRIDGRNGKDMWDAPQKLQSIVQAIQKVDESYEPPEIAKERFRISAIEEEVPPTFRVENVEESSRFRITDTTPSSIIPDPIQTNLFPPIQNSSNEQQAQTPSNEEAVNTNNTNSFRFRIRTVIDRLNNLYR